MPWPQLDDVMWLTSGSVRWSHHAKDGPLNVEQKPVVASGSSGLIGSALGT